MPADVAAGGAAPAKRLVAPLRDRRAEGARPRLQSF